LDAFSRLYEHGLLFKLLRLLNVQDVVHLAQVNNFLSKHCRDQQLWRFFCERDFKDFKKKQAKSGPSSSNNSNKRFIKLYKEEYLKGKPTNVESKQ